MKKIWYTVLLLVFFLPRISAQNQPDKNAALVQKLEQNVKNAEAKVKLNERKLAVADSLISSGTQMTTESKAEMKSLGLERKKLDKEYSTQQKLLMKQSNSKDKDEAAKAKVDLKSLDAKYKVDSKALDDKVKAATKKSTTGDANLNKGKAAKSAAEAQLDQAKASLEEAQAKYDAATGKTEETDQGKKKGKK